MKNQQIRASFFIIALISLTLLTFWLRPPDELEDSPTSPTQETTDGDVIDRDSQESDEFTGQADDSVDQQKGIAANLDDIAKASTVQFPVQHSVENGFEWIRASGMEEYLVLKPAEPPLQSKDVTGVQNILKKLQMYQGEVDGIYGPETVAAVKRFQEGYGLSPNGVVDLDDYHLLAEIYEETIPALAKPKPQGNVSILILLDERTLYVLQDGTLYHQFPVAVGNVDTPSPIGSWKIVSKDAWGEGFGTRWLGLNVPYGRFGIHGTNQPWSIGGAESHGCLRMFNRDIEILYRWVTWGTRVQVSGGQFPYNIPWRTIRDGDRGSDVWFIQNRLKELGYLKGRPDGVYGQWTKQLIMRYQKDQKLPVTGVVDWATRERMGFYNFQ